MEHSEGRGMSHHLSVRLSTLCREASHCGCCCGHAPVHAWDMLDLTRWHRQCATETNAAIIRGAIYVAAPLLSTRLIASLLTAAGASASGDLGEQCGRIIPVC
jgi:hypothetical protein